MTDEPINQYLVLFRSLADRLIRTGSLEVPQLIQLQSASMLIAIAQKLGDLPGDAIPAAYLERVSAAIKAMRMTWASANAAANDDKERSTWN
jgi:hypothetical protein